MYPGARDYSAGDPLALGSRNCPNGRPMSERARIGYMAWLPTVTVRGEVPVRYNGPVLNWIRYR